MRAQMKVPEPRKAPETRAAPAARTVTDPALEVAQTLAGVLDEALTGRTPTVTVSRSAAQGLHLVHHDTDRFAAQVAGAVRLGLPLPVVHETTLLPVDTGDLFADAADAGDADGARDLLARVLARPERLGVESVELAAPDEAAGGFVDRALAFLRVRFAGDSGTTPPPTAVSEPVPVEVIGPEAGLRVLCHPAYWLGDVRAFGDPTSPVTGYLLPGRYAFGVEGGASPRRFDRVDHEVMPPGCTVRLAPELLTW